MMTTRNYFTLGIELAIIALLFFASIVLRTSEFNHSRGNAVDWQTAHATITQQLWTDGAWKRHWFSPIITFPGDANKFIPYWGQPINAAGEAYYISYPPFLFIAPFIVTQLLGVYPADATTEGFNLFLHLLGAIVFVLFLKMITPVARGTINTAALAGGALFLFLPGNLFNFQNSYFANTLALVFFTAGIMQYMHIDRSLRAGSAVTRLQYATLGALTFFFAYTDWLSVFWAATFVLTLSFQHTIRKTRTLIVVVFASAFLALLLTAYQYGQVIPIRDVLHALLIRGVERSSFDPGELIRIFIHQGWYHLPLAAAIFFVMLSSRRAGFHLALTSDQRGALSISLFPVLLQYLFLPQFSAEHNFSAMIASPFLIILFLIIIRQCIDIDKGRTTLDKNVLLALTAIIFLASSFLFYSSHFTKEQYLSETILAERLGSEMLQRARSDEIVFMYYENVPQELCKSYPPLMYYARRNIKCVSSLDDARQFISYTKEKTGIRRGAVFSLGDDFTIKTIDRIFIQ